MAFTLTPELLQKALTGLGIAAGQLKQFDAETKQALGRFVLRALGSGDANGYVKERLEWLEDRDQPAVEPPPRPARSRRTVVDAQFVDGRSRERGRGRRT